MNIFRTNEIPLKRKEQVEVSGCLALYWKAVTIQHNEDYGSAIKNIVLRLGPFHTEMSFLGSIRYLMSGSGLQEVLEIIYADTSVTHMLSGKAISRAMRGHLLLDTALNTLLMMNAYKIDEFNSDAEYDAISVGYKTLINCLQDGTMSVEEVCLSPHIEPVQMKFESLKKSLKNARTSKLWFQYMKQVDILRQFRKAQRTGNWLLHVEALKHLEV